VASDEWGRRVRVLFEMRDAGYLHLGSSATASRITRPVSGFRFRFFAFEFRIFYLRFSLIPILD
jgi:hypothetical protein